MALTGYQQFVVDNSPPEQWPDDVFVAYLVENVPLRAWREWLEKRVLEVVRGNQEHWPLRSLLQAATGKPVALPVMGSTKAQELRKQRALRRLEQNEEVQREVARLRALQPSSASDSEPDASIGNWKERVWRDASAYAETHSLPQVHADDVRAYLFEMATYQPSEVERMFEEYLRNEGVPLDPPGWRALQDTKPQLWANLSTRHVPLLMPPGSIIIDVTRSTMKDVAATWKGITDTQARLGQPKDKGGRPENEALYLRMAELRRTETWPNVAKIINDEFPLEGDRERDPNTLGRQFRTWAKRTGRWPM